ncbi:MAG TPA: penicillin-binding protein 1C [Chryseolinea sp.]
MTRLANIASPLKKYQWYLGALVILLCVYFYCLPENLFQDPYSTVLEDRRGELLSATIADDGQWRFPESREIPDKFSEALITYEDKRFRSHPGVDLLSMGRAIRQNIKAGRVVSGGSTLSMQLIRLSRKAKDRNIFEKIIEIVMATRLELSYSKEEILAMYASHAPFGGNVVGLEAACWRYFGRASAELSWGEASMLAVLPNAPSLIHPGRNRNLLRAKRDFLLDKLKSKGIIDAFTCSLAKDEPLPDEPLPLPRHARLLLSRARQEGYDQQKIKTTIQSSLQVRVEQIVSDHQQRLKGNRIFNAAALIADVRNGEVLTYVGNTDRNDDESHGNDVDVITAPRSTGSILKPFLYAAMLDEGKILPKTLVADIPTVINGFSPKNFSKDYDGAVSADNALIRSLNVPAVHMLRSYRYEKFHSLLKGMGMTTLVFPPDHYGLSLILGGAEGTLWDIAGMYASMGRTSLNYFEHPGKNRYDRKDFHALKYIVDKSTKSRISDLENNSWLSASAIYQTLNVLTEVYRPGEESGWKHFDGAKKIAWKTGTSFGFRDGWAIGVTPGYVVAVWVGNASGEGRPGLTGTDAAAPLMFDIFSQLEGGPWFQMPRMEMERITVCALSGQRNTGICDDVDTVWVTKRGLESFPCSFHKIIHTTADRKYRVHSGCEQLNKVASTNWFVLPPTQEHFFKTKHQTYRPLPPYRKDCDVTSAHTSMDLVYPKPDSRIFIPRELNGKSGRAICELVHRNPNITVHWHLDGTYLGSTKKNHRLAINPDEGRHLLVMVDDDGNTLEEYFEVLSSL